MTRQRKRSAQHDLPFRSWGGARRGAGRKPAGARAGVPHRERSAFASRFPVHVTARLRAGLPRLRSKRVYAALRAAFAAGCDRSGFRLVHYSVQNNHLHLIVEARDRRSLARGVQGLKIRVAKALNRLWGRKGSVFSDRYHDHVLRTPREVRSALCYVLHNARKHALRIAQGLDYFASGVWFDGWKEKFKLRGVPAPAVVPARTWLLSGGWRKRGLISLYEEPGRWPP